MAVDFGVDLGPTSTTTLIVATHIDVIAWLQTPLSFLPYNPTPIAIGETILVLLIDAWIKQHPQFVARGLIEAVANGLRRIPVVGALASPWSTQAARGPDGSVK